VKVKRKRKSERKEGGYGIRQVYLYDDFHRRMNADDDDDYRTIMNYQNE
jgi:hypothetical protein